MKTFELLLWHEYIESKRFTLQYWENFNDREYPEVDKWYKISRAKEELQEAKKMTFTDIIKEGTNVNNIILIVMRKLYRDVEDMSYNKYIVIDRIRGIIALRWIMNSRNDDHFKLYSTKYLIRTL